MDDNKIAESINKLSLSSGDVSTCANCGKEGNNTNTCNKCDLAVRYCNAACKKKHRHKHKTECERRVAELHEEQLERKKRSAELHDIELFKHPPPNEDCPICMLILPSCDTGYRYRICCGKMICSGCIYAVEKRDGYVGLCPFCRAPAPNEKEIVEQMKTRIEVNDDAYAMHGLGCFYGEGKNGVPQDHAKALELWQRSANLGNTKSYYSLGIAFVNGEGVKEDFDIAIPFFALAAMGGDIDARHNLGALEKRTDRALKHFMIAAGTGCTASLDKIKQMFMKGDVPKDDYTNALRVYQTHITELKSPQRDEAAAFDEDYKYY